MSAQAFHVRASRRPPSRPRTPASSRSPRKVNTLLDIAQVNLGEAGGTYVAADAAAASSYTGF